MYLLRLTSKELTIMKKIVDTIDHPTDFRWQSFHSIDITSSDKSDAALVGTLYNKGLLFREDKSYNCRWYGLTPKGEYWARKFKLKECKVISLVDKCVDISSDLSEISCQIT